ncbi:MAG TPA: hypothetical protein VI670_14090 [Thermoanaerobaculia bacterium]
MDPDGLGKLRFIAKVVELIEGRGFRVIGKFMNREAAKAAFHEGEDLLMANRKAASELATELGEGRPPIHELHQGEGQYPHYHPAGRGGGHIFYDILAGATITNHLPSNTAPCERLDAEIIDFLNPASLGQDLLVLWDRWKSEENTLFEAITTTAKSDWEKAGWFYSIPGSSFWYNVARTNHDNGHFVSTYDLFNSGRMCIEGVCR